MNAGARRAPVTALALAGALLLCAITRVHATPPTPAEIATLCAAAEDQSHCGRLVEAWQLPRLPGLATRNGDELRVALYPSGAATFRDEVRITGAQTYALWDALDRINGVLLFTTDGDRSGFLLLLRGNGRQIRLPAEPVLSPDRQFLVTADFCASGCENEVAVWRITRDDVRKDRAWRPDASWNDVTATWQGTDRLAVEYQRAGSDAAQRVEIALADPRWRPSR
jgi:hypothetical protein